LLEAKDLQITKYIMEDYTLEFVKPFHDNINYRKEQKELIDKAEEISNGDKLSALNYIVTSLLHNNIKDVEFELEFTIPANTSATITLPIVESNPIDELGYYVSWGNNDITHNIDTYTYEPTNIIKEYQVKFFGLGITGFGKYGINKDYNKYLTKVISFGQLGHMFTSLEYAFSHCKNNFDVPKDLPSSITDLSSMFEWCEKFNKKLDWNTRNITTMDEVFSQCKNFNQNLQWDLTNATTLEHMFSGCEKFNQNLQWDISPQRSKVKNIKMMFCFCPVFNQNLQWDTSGIETMDGIFGGCTNFNQKLEWNTINTTTMAYMFDRCTNFNQKVDFDITKVVDMGKMFKECHNFNQKLEWIIPKHVNIENMFLECNIAEENKPRIEE